MVYELIKVRFTEYVVEIMTEEHRLEKLKIIGMHCATCAVTIEKKLKSLAGVVEAAVNFATEEAEVRYNPGRISLSDIVRAVRDVEYDVYKEEMRKFI